MIDNGQAFVGKTRFVAAAHFQGGVEISYFQGCHRSNGAVTADQSGALYTTAYGGGFNGCGTVIKLTPTGNRHTPWAAKAIWTFANGDDGCGPSSGLIADSTGAFYGTTAFGGSGNGTAYKLTPPAPGQVNWTKQTLSVFGGGSDASTPFAPLSFGPGGVLYGTSELGGGHADCFGNTCGAVFALTPPANGQTAWTEQVIWGFSGTDGANPDGGLLVGAGAIYGTTLNGGATGQNGVAYKLIPPQNGQAAWTGVNALGIYGHRRIGVGRSTHRR